MADLSQAGREALEDLIEWCAGPLGLEQYGAVESDSNGEPITCLLSLGTLRAGMAALRKARAALAAREEPQTCVCNAKCWRVGGEAACLYVSDNSWKAAMAARATVLAAAAREDAERPERELYLARREPPSMGLNVIDGAHADEEGVARAAKLHCRIFSPKAGEGPAVMVEVFPVPDLDPSINEGAADACRGMVRDTEQEREG